MAGPITFELMAQDTITFIETVIGGPVHPVTRRRGAPSQRGKFARLQRWRHLRAGHLSRFAVAISSLVSLGDIDDVDGTDMLLWWESDPATKLALLYLESIANPRKFARTARRVGRGVPVLTVIVGRSMTSRRVSGTRATAATPLLTRQALFAQAGVFATANLG